MTDSDAPGGPDQARLSEFERVSLLPPRCRDALLSCVGGRAACMMASDWSFRARPDQLPPPGDWSTWLVMAGRGFGKTRMGAEWVREIARRDGNAVIALVGATLNDARSVMVEGPSGVLAVTPQWSRPIWQPSRRELRWENGARARIFGASDPDALRGPQHSHGWADEIGKWSNGVRAWDNLAMGMRLGTRPQLVATTTPRPVPLVMRLHADPSTAVTTGRTRDNASALPEAFLQDMERDFGGTHLGRQELEGALLLDVEGALWTRALLEDCRAPEAGPGDAAFARIVVAVDPPASAHGDSCGIVVAGVAGSGIAYVLEDASIEGASPERWARRVADAAERWTADRIVAEANNGGDMVGAVLRATNVALPVKLVHAARGKSARAEPVAALYEAGRVRHAGLFGKLEDQMCGLTLLGYQGPGRSPDRADALVWALTEILLSYSGNARLRCL